MNAFEDVTLRGSERVVLDPLTASDAPFVHRAVQDPEIRRWLPLPQPYPLALAVEFCTVFAPEVRTSGKGLIRAVRVDGQFAGVIDAKRVDWRSRVCEIGYWLAPSSRGRGVMTAAVTVLADWLLTAAQFERVELRIAPANEASTRIAARSGFTVEGVARNAGFTDTGRVDLSIYSRIPADLAAPPRHTQR